MQNFPHSPRNIWSEKAIQSGLLFCAFISVATTLGIIVILAKESFEFFREVSVFDFLFGTQWSPLFEPPSFGILPLLLGTMHIVVGSCLIAIPIGVITALYLSEYASNRTRQFIKPALEILAGIPTVVYGYFALTFVTPILQKFFPSADVFNSLSASIVVGIMILPMVASLCDDAFSSVPRTLREGAYALGATHFEVNARVVFPAALSGIMASFVLAFSRAIGETMAVTLAAGATPNLTLNPLKSIQTMTSYIVQVSLGDAPAGTIGYKTIFSVGMLLFVITLGTNFFAYKILRRFRGA